MLSAFSIGDFPLSQPITVRTAHRLMKVLGHGARTHATQTALDMRAIGDSEQERLWLDIADVIHKMQAAPNEDRRAAAE